MRKLEAFFMIVVLLCTISLESAVCNEEISPQELLLEKFFGSGRRMAEVLPKKNISDHDPLQVHFNFIINHIFDIKSDSEEIYLMLWIALRWTNQLVSWNYTEYPVKFLEVDSDKLWKPKMFIVEDAQGKGLYPNSGSSSVTIYPDGYTALDYPATVKLSCAMPACLFPMDKHTCKVTIIAIGYDTNQLILVPDNEISSKYKTFSKKGNGLWTLTMDNFTTKNGNVIALSNKTRRSSMLTTAINVKHKPMYFWITVLFPITLICVVTFCAVLLPRDSGERTSLLITCFLAQVVYLDTVLNNVPKSSDYIPLLVMFLFIVLIFTAFQIALTSVTSYYANRANQGKKLTSWHKSAVMFFSKICFIGKGKKKKKNHVKALDSGSFYEAEMQNAKTISVKTTSFDQQAENTAEDAEIDSKEEAKNKEEDEPPAKKCQACKKACKAVDRLSMFASFILLLSAPILFDLMYKGKINYDCAVQQ